MPDEVREARKLNRLELERIINEYIFMNKSELTARLKAAETTALETMIGTIILKAVGAGDFQRLNFLLDRLVGKPPERIEEVEMEVYERPESMRGEA